MNLHPLNFLVHFSNVLMLLSYSVREILWLRWFAVAAALTNIPYFLLQPHTLWPPIVWAMIFTVINLYQILLIYMDRRPVVLSDEERKLYEMAFKSLRPREFISLLMAVEWKTAGPGETVLAGGKPVSSVSIAISGTLKVSKDGKDLMPLKPGHLIGTALALTGSLFPWRPRLLNPLVTFPGRSAISAPLWTSGRTLRLILQSLVSRDLAAKMEQLSTYLPSGSN